VAVEGQQQFLGIRCSKKPLESLRFQGFFISYRKYRSKKDAEKKVWNVKQFKRGHKKEKQQKWVSIPVVACGLKSD
jgi:hypothetical protein